MSNNYGIKVVIQCSGGVESTTLIAQAITTLGRENVFPIVYPNKSVFWTNRDATAVKRVLMDFDLQQNTFYCENPDYDQLECGRTSEFTEVGFIPGFKLIMNACAMAYAQKVGATQIWTGNMGANTYADETPEFATALEELYNKFYPTTQGITIVEPFAGKTKAEVIKIGYSLMKDRIFDTLSCGDERTAGGYNCGLCPGCRKRRDGFQDALGFDKTPYLFDGHVNRNFCDSAWGVIDKLPEEFNNGK